MFKARITVYPDVPPRIDNGLVVGGFGPGSFTDLLQRPIHLPGLDQGWTHTLIAVKVAPDYDSAELTVHSRPVAALSVDQHVRVVQGVPAAHVRVHDPDGQVLAETALAAPLRPGQELEIGGRRHVVQTHTWPGRHPETGVCEGDLDWQHVTVIEQPPLSVTPVPAA